MIRVAQIMGYMNGGGVEQIVLNYYRHLDREQVQFDFLVCEGSSHVPIEEISSMGGRVFEIPAYQKPFSYQRVVKDLCRKHKWPIVHSHVNALSFFPLRAAKKAGVPVRIAHSHSSSGGGEGEFARDILKGILKHLSACYPTHRFACGDTAGRWLFGDAFFEVIPNAINLSEFRPGASDRTRVLAELDLPQESFVVGHAGRMVPQKNQKRLLRIFAALRLLEPRSVLLFVGDGPLDQELRKEAHFLGIAESVRFLGQRSDMSRLYRAFDVFCLPSAYEGFPVASVECQASAVPLLVSSAVGDETAITSLVEFESLSSSDKSWAMHLLSLKGARATPSDIAELDRFDISVAACRLQQKYLAAAEELAR